MLRSLINYFLIAVPLLMGLAACTSVLGSGSPTPTPTTAYATYDAQVDKVTVQMSNSPLQAIAIVQGKLNEACARLGEIQQSYQAPKFLISVPAISPIDRGCVQITTPFEEKVPLDISNLSAGSYTVVVNGVVSDTFTLNAGNLTPTKGP